ncbi:hypothetical protein ACF0H5_001569 [Mactra antiquata]
MGNWLCYECGSLIKLSVTDSSVVVIPRLHCTRFTNVRYIQCTCSSHPFRDFFSIWGRGLGTFLYIEHLGNFYHNFIDRGKKTPM